MKKARNSKARREKVPFKIASKILAESHHRCCLCNANWIMPEIHHIDNNPSNNDPENLIPLCPNCHSTVHQKGAKGRSFSKTELNQIRRKCFAVIPTKEKKLSKDSLSKNRDFLLSLFAQFEVRKIRYKMNLVRFSWKEIIQLLQSLIPYGQEYDYDVCSEILSAVSTVACDTKNNMPEDVIRTMVHVLIQVLPIYTIVSPSKRRITKKKSDLVLRAIEIEHDILWDVCRYLRKLKYTEEAAYLLYYLLRFSHLNGLKKVKKRALQVFDSCERICEEKRQSKSFPKGKKLLKSFKKMAMEE